MVWFRCFSTQAEFSTVKIGTEFELRTQACLSRYNFNLKRVGGAGDKGVDLSGFWKIPVLRKHIGLASSCSVVRPLDEIKRLNNVSEIASFPVLIQCKLHSQTLGPVYFRELMGTLAAVHKYIPDSGDSESNLQLTKTIGFLVSGTGFTAAALDEFRPAKLPMGAISLNDDGICVSFMLNHAAAKLLPQVNILDRPGIDLNDVHSKSRSGQLRITGLDVVKEASKRGEVKLLVNGQRFPTANV
ncbi:hypothetical protein HK098_001863 [Nowakowskiella sp. JEL0407]|nr:hypothetical protein HK098_001863 [Nowakowskiella sp. JEL0407]